MTTCVSEQAFPLSPCTCLLWSLHIQTGGNNFSNCRRNWQAWLSRLHLLVLSGRCRITLFPGWYYACLSFSNHCVRNPTLHSWLISTTQMVTWRRGTHTSSHFAVTGRCLCGCLHVCLQTLLMKFTLCWSSASIDWDILGGPHSTQTPQCCVGGHRRRISQQAEAEITYCNWE